MKFDFTSLLKNETALRTKFEEMALKKVISFILLHFLCFFVKICVYV